MRSNRALVMSLGIILLANACSSASGPDTTAEPATATPVVGSTTVRTAAATTTTAFTTTGIDSRLKDGAAPGFEGTTSGEVTGVAPDSVIHDVLGAAESFTGADRAEMELLRAQAVTWTDGSLGCPEPGSTYTQALVDGYWVQLGFGGATLDFRVNDRGGVRLCERAVLDPGTENDSQRYDQSGADRLG